MSRFLLVLLTAFVLLAGALWYASSNRTSSTDAVRTETFEQVSTDTVRPAELVGATSPTQHEEPGDGNGYAPPDGREQVPTAFDEELAGAHWVEGRVVFPPGTPADEEAWVVARGRVFSDGSDHRASVASDGSFRVAFRDRTIMGRLDLDARYVYLPTSVRWKSRHEGAVVLEPSLGGRLVVTVVPPPGSSRPLEGRLWLSSHGGGVEQQRALQDVSTVEWRAIAPARHSLTYRGDFFAAEDVSVAVEAGATTSAELHLRPGVSLAGTVVDEEGIGVPDASVGWMRVEGPGDHGFKLHPQTTQTDSLGRFRLDAFLAGDTQVDARCDGFLPQSLSLGHLSEGTVRDDLVVVLSRGRSVTGRVTWPDGRPAEASIVMTPRLELDPSSGLPTQPLSTLHMVRGESDADGLFAITGLADHRYALVATARTKEVTKHVDPGTGRERSRSVTTTWKAEAEVGPGSADLSLVLSSGIHLRGRAVDELGEPIERFTVRARGPDSGSGVPPYQNKTFRTADGSFDLEGLSEGQWRIEADARGYARSSEIRVTLPSTKPVELVLPREALVRGTVLDAGGEPLAGALVRALQYAPGHFVPTQEFTNERGEFEIGGLRAGRTTLVTEGTEDAPSEDYVLDLAPAQEVDGIVLRLRVGGTLLVEVVNPRTWMVVDVTRSDGRLFVSDASELDAEGRCVVTGLPDGTFEVRAIELGGLELSETFTLGPAGTASVRLVCPEETTRLRGTVTLGEEAVTSASVSLHAEVEEPTSYSASHSHTGANGKFGVTAPSGRTLELVVRDERWSWTGVIDVPSVPEHTVGLSLLRVSGSVGAGAPERAVVVATGDGSTATCDVDARGGFDLGLTPGTYRLALETRQGESVVELVGALRVERDLELGELVVPGSR